jgi:hypothetical protein
VMAEYIKHNNTAQRVSDDGNSATALGKVWVMLAMLQIPANCA